MFSKCDPQPDNVSFTWELVEMRILRPRLDLWTRKSLVVGREDADGLCLSLPEILMHTQVEELLRRRVAFCFVSGAGWS